MKLKSGAQQDWRGVSGTSTASPDTAVGRLPVPLDDNEQRVVDCLESAPGGLTLRQLEIKMPACTADVGKVLAGLVDRKVVRSLNTLIPTYTLREPGAGVHAK